MAARVAPTTNKTATAPKKVVRVPRAAVTREKPERDVATLNLRAYVPDPAIAQRYVGRKVEGGVWDAVLAENARRKRKNILLEGDTGSGKTMFGEALASKNQELYYSVPCDVSIDPSSFFGKMMPTEVAGKFEWIDGPVTEVVRKGGVLNISEINFMQPKIAASLYPLLDGRRYIPLLGHHGEVVRAHPNLLVLADMNPNYRGTMEINAAFRNRFAYKVRWGYDPEVEAKLVKSDAVRELAKKLRAQVGTELLTPVSTNMLMEFEEFAVDTDLGLEFAMVNFLNAFNVDERPAVEKVVTLHKTALRTSMARLVGASAADDDDLEEVEYNFSIGD